MKGLTILEPGADRRIRSLPRTSDLSQWIYVGMVYQISLARATLTHDSGPMTSMLRYRPCVLIIRCSAAGRMGHSSSSNISAITVRMASVGSALLLALRSLAVTGRCRSSLPSFSASYRVSFHGIRKRAYAVFNRYCDCASSRSSRPRILDCSDLYEGR